nr:DNA-directed DNA polymerase [Tanacetum cinerariifolium]
MKMNTASSSGLGTLPSNTITNPNEDLNGITTRSKFAYKGPTIPTTSSPSKVIECETEPVVAPVVEPVEALVSALKPNLKPLIPYPSRLHDQKLRDKANDQKEKIFQIFQDLNFNISFTDALILMPKFGLTIKSLLTDKEKLFELAKTPLNEHCSAVLLKKLPEKLGDPGKFLILCDFPGMDECLALADIGASINLMPLSMWNKLSPPELSLLKTGRALIDVYKGELFEVLGFSVSGNPTPSMKPIVLTSSPTLTPFGDSDFILEETDAFLAIDDKPISPEIDNSYYDSEGDILLLEEFLNDDPSSPPLPPHELKGDDKLPVIIAKDLKDEEKTALIKILIEDEFKPTVQHQRRVNPKIHEVIKKEVLKLLDAELIYPISDGLWVSPVHCVPKKGGFTVVKNEENKLIPTRLVTGWRVCIDYQKLNDATHKDYFPLPFMDQMLKKLAGNEYYCFLDDFSGYFQILIDPQDQEKTTFTCMMAIFHDMIEKTMEVFMDDFSVFRNLFGTCLSHLDKMLKRCEDTNLCLNWEKSHFMVKEDIVLGHKIPKNVIEVDKAKFNVIAKLPHPTTVKGIHSFLGHAGFYRRFIQDFSKIAQPITRLLEKDTSFIFSKECIEAFQSLKKKLTEAPILVAPDWDLPFELMLDASDFSIVAVLEQRKTKHFQPIHYASKMMIDAQAHYTTTEKELLFVVMPSRDRSSGFYSFKNLVSSSVIKKEEAENLASNHMSRLENPHKSVLNKKETNETFPLETLNVSSDGVFTARKPLIFSRLVTMDPPGDIMARTTPPKRCLTLVFIGPQSIVMPMTWSNLVTLFNIKEKFSNEMKYLKIPSKFARFSTFGASISWGHSRLHEGT